MESSHPAISVLMPVYNGERFLREAIDSILSQTFRDFELIIINDGSTDNTESIIQSYSDSRIKYVKNEKNLKLIKTLNKGIGLAKGKYIARMDADDVSLPNRLELQYAFMESHSNVGASSSLIYSMSETGIVKGISKYYGCTTTMSCLYSSLLRSPLVHPVSIIRTSLLKEIKYSDTKDALHIEDFVLWGNILKYGYDIANIEKPLLYYRDVSGSISHKYKNLQKINHAKVVKSQLEYFLKMILTTQEALDMFVTNKDLTFQQAIHSFELLDNIKSAYTYRYRDKLNRKAQKEILRLTSSMKKEMIMRDGKYGNWKVRIIAVFQLFKYVFGLL